MLVCLITPLDPPPANKRQKRERTRQSG